MLRHLGNTSGQGAEGAGASAVVEERDKGATVEDANAVVEDKERGTSGEDAGALLGGGTEVGAGAMHFVQIVEVSVVMIVDTVWVVWTIGKVPDVRVCVNGHIVVVV